MTGPGRPQEFQANKTIKKDYVNEGN